MNLAGLNYYTHFVYAKILELSWKVRVGWNIGTGGRCDVTNKDWFDLAERLVFFLICVPQENETEVHAFLLF